MADLERFDPALLGVAQQISATAAPGENPIDTLLDIYFGFLRRKTDFFRRVAACCQLAPWGREMQRGRAHARLYWPQHPTTQLLRLGRRGEAAAAHLVPRAGVWSRIACGAGSEDATRRGARASQRTRKHSPADAPRRRLRSGGATEGRAKDAVLRALARQAEIAAREEAGAFTDTLALRRPS